MEETRAVTVLWAAEDRQDTEEWSGDLGDLKSFEDAYTQIHPRSDELERARDEQEVKAASSSQDPGRKWEMWTNLLSRFRRKQTEESKVDATDEASQGEIKERDQQPRGKRDHKAMSYEQKQALERCRSLMSTMGFEVAFGDRAWQEEMPNL